MPWIRTYTKRNIPKDGNSPYDTGWVYDSIANVYRRKAVDVRCPIPENPVLKYVVCAYKRVWIDSSSNSSSSPSSLSSLSLSPSSPSSPSSQSSQSPGLVHACSSIGNIVNFRQDVNNNTQAYSAVINWGWFGYNESASPWLVGAPTGGVRSMTYTNINICAGVILSPTNINNICQTYLNANYPGETLQIVTGTQVKMGVTQNWYSCPPPGDSQTLTDILLVSPLGNSYVPYASTVFGGAYGPSQTEEFINGIVDAQITFTDTNSNGYTIKYSDMTLSLDDFFTSATIEIKIDDAGYNYSTYLWDGINPLSCTDPGPPYTLANALANNYAAFRYPWGYNYTYPYVSP